LSCSYAGNEPGVGGRCLGEKEEKTEKKKKKYWEKKGKKGDILDCEFSSSVCHEAAIYTSQSTEQTSHVANPDFP